MAGKVGRNKEGGQLPLKQRRELYAARKLIGTETESALGLRIQVDVYFKDPHVAQAFPGVGLDNEFSTPWEPGLSDGPTSARFAVVDYDGTTGTLHPPAEWDSDNNAFR